MPDTDRTEASPLADPLLDRSADALLRARVVLVYGPVDTALALRVTAQLVALATSGSAPIRILIHSPGGHVEAGDTIHDVIRAVAPDAIVIGTGWVASAGALIYAAGKKGNRLALPNTRFMLHQPLGGVGGPAADVEIEVKQIVQMRARLNAIFARATGRDVDSILRDTERNFWMSAEEAVRYGLVDRIVEGLDDLRAASVGAQ